MSSTDPRLCIRRETFGRDQFASRVTWLKWLLPTATVQSCQAGRSMAFGAPPMREQHDPLLPSGLLRYGNSSLGSAEAGVALAATPAGVRDRIMRGVPGRAADVPRARCPVRQAPSKRPLTRAPSIACTVRHQARQSTAVVGQAVVQPNLAGARRVQHTPPFKSRGKVNGGLFGPVADRPFGRQDGLGGLDPVESRDRADRRVILCRPTPVSGGIRTGCYCKYICLQERRSMKNALAFAKCRRRFISVILIYESAVVSVGRLASLVRLAPG